MTFRTLAFALSVSLLGCTGARVSTGSTPLADAVVIYWHCGDGQLRAHWRSSDSQGYAIWNPFDSDSNDTDSSQIVPAGKVVVTVEKGSLSRQRIITHAFNATCDIPFNNSMQELDCSKDGFNLTASTDTYSSEYDAPVYRMPTTFTWTGGAHVIGIPGTSNMVFPAEWPASCRNTGSVGTIRGAIQMKKSISNIR